MKAIIAKLLGSSWRTSLLGYGQLFLVTAFELAKTGETNFGNILLSAGAALFARIVADSAQAKKNS